MKSRFVVISLFAACCSISAFARIDVLVSRNGESRCRIALPAAPTQSQKYAASELGRYLKRMVGVDAEMLEGAEKTCEFRISGRDGDPDSFHLRRRGGTLEISGGERGVIYGVYEALERFGGCRWYSSDHEKVPFLDAFVVPDGYDEEFKPAFRMRYPFWTDVRESPDFAAKLRANGPYSAKPIDAAHGGTVYRWGGELGSSHTLRQLVPVAKYGKDHAEYFALRHGVRDVHTPDPQLCLSNPDAVKLVAAKTLERMRGDPAAGFYGVSQNDNERYCECDTCAHIDAEEGSHAGSMIRFVNAVAAAVEGDFPNAVIETLAYRHTRKPPAKTGPRHNVAVCLCTIECDFSQPLADSPYASNRAFVQDIAGWGKIAKRLFVWDYAVNFSHYLAPMVDFDALAANVRFFRDHGVTDLFEQGVSAVEHGGYHAFFAEYKAYLLAKLMWNPDLDEKTLTDDFFAGYYGPAAPPMRAYFDETLAMERNWRETPGGELTVYQSPDESPFDLAFYDRAAVLHDRALEATKCEDPVFARHVRQSRLTVDYCRFHLLYRGIDLVSPPDDAEAFAESKACLVRLRDVLSEERPVAFAQHPEAEAWMQTMVTHPEKLPPHGKRRKCYAEIEDAVCSVRSTAEAERVADPLADDGRAIKCFGDRHGWCVNVHGLGGAKTAQGAKYRVRVRVRVERLPGKRGNAFWSGVYNWNPTLKERLARTVKIGEVVDDGYAWYELGEWSPERGDFFWFGSGDFSRANGGGPCVRAVYLDKLEINAEK